MASPREDSALALGAGRERTSYNLHTTAGANLLASLKPIAEDGTIDATAADRGPHGLSDPKALTFYRDRLIALDGREVKVINLD